MSTGSFYGGQPYAGPAADDLRRDWGWFLALGVALILLGVAALFANFLFTFAGALLFGVLLLVGGAFQVVQAFGTRRWSGFFLHLLLGILYGVAGVVLVADPLGGAIALTLVLAALFLAAGFLRVFLAFQIRRSPSWGWLLPSGLLSLLLGVLILAGWPGTGLWVIGLFIGVELLFSGLALVLFALSARPGGWAAAS